MKRSSHKYDDEVDLVELFKVIWLGKLKIISIVFFFF